MNEDRRSSRLSSLPVINPNDKVEQLRQEFARENPAQEKLPNQRSLIDRALDTSKPPHHKALEEKIIEQLKTVYDPEIPVDIYELGLIYGIDIAEDNAVRIRMTLTAPGCPVAGSLVAEVERKIESLDEVKSCNVDLVWDPPWTKERMSEAALLELGLL